MSAVWPRRRSGCASPRTASSQLPRRWALRRCRISTSSLKSATALLREITAGSADRMVRPGETRSRECRFAEARGRQKIPDAFRLEGVRYLSFQTNGRPVCLCLFRYFRPAARRGPAQWPLCPTYALRPSPAYKGASSLVQWPFSGCPRYHRAYTFLSAFR